MVDNSVCRKVVKISVMIDAVQVCSLGLDRDITLPPSFVKEIG